MNGARHLAMSEYVQDASAILALLNRETGCELVEAMLPHAIVSAVNLAEVCRKLTVAGMSRQDVQDVVSLLGLTIIPFDEESAFLDGEIHRNTQLVELSLGDRACLLLARQTDRVAITADRVWKNVETGAEIQLIR
jgi:ribonuclease VapC